MIRSEKKQLWVVLLIIFLGFIGISIPYLIFPALFLNPAFSLFSNGWTDSSRALYLGITLAAYPLGQFIGSPILGSLSDDYGRKKLLSGSLFIAALCNLLTGVAILWADLTLLIVSRFAAGFMEGNIAIARAMAADMTSISKHRTIGSINAAASIAYLVGPLIGGLMTDRDLFLEATLSTPFYTISLLFLALGLLATLVLKDGKKVKREETRGFLERINLIRRISFLFSNKHLRFLMITSTCFTLAVDIFYEFGPVYLTVKWVLSPKELVLYNGVLCLALAIGNGWLPTIVSARIPNYFAVIAAIGGFAFLLMAMVLTTSPIMMIFLYTLSGIAIGLGVTLLTVKISNAAAENIQGEVMGVQLSLRVLGDATICLFGGVLLLFSSKLILMAGSLVSFFAMIYYFFKGQKKALQSTA